MANQTSATFLRVVGSELIQKYLGEGPKLVRELFRMADEMAPSIVFIDEIDAVGTKRYALHPPAVEGVRVANVHGGHVWRRVCGGCVRERVSPYNVCVSPL